MRSQTEVFTRIVRDHMAPPPPQVVPDTPCAEAVRRIVAAAASSAVVADDAGLPVGIVTERDITRRLAFQAATDTAIGEAMSTPVRTIRDSDFLFRAIAEMRRHGLRHMPVADDGGRIVGILHLHVALSIAASRMVEEIDLLAHEGTVEGMTRIKRSQVEVAAALFADNVPAPEIQSLLTDINRDIYRRVVELALREMDAEGLGAPPVAFSVIVMGSGGRGENYIYPDQDNGFILDDYPDADHDRIDGFFIELAERMTQTLDKVGLPLCKGYVMATNPLWRKTLPQWRAQTTLWAKRRGVVALRLSDIFYDFHSVYGERALADDLRAHVTRLTQGSPIFLSAMYKEGEDHGVALGWFGRFITEQDVDEHKGEINLKHSGTLPLVEAVRLLCLKNGIAETSTLARLEALHEIGYLDGDDLDYLKGAFRLLTGLLLRQQVADFQAGERVNNYVPPESMSTRERDMLIDAFKAIAALRDRVRTEFTGDVF
jgi:signal-transduction protein with cAMP-binding, CBS, and nucleotidyltransferase domain